MKRNDHAINRVLKSHNLGTLDDPGITSVLGDMVQNHEHFTELLRACEPDLRREMYEAMRPHLNFPAKPLEDYVVAAKDHAVAAQLPVMDSAGKLHPFKVPSAGAVTNTAGHEDFTVTCRRCGRGVHFINEPRHLAVKNLRDSGWAYDEFGNWHLCPECLNAMDPKTS